MSKREYDHEQEPGNVRVPCPAQCGEYIIISKQIGPQDYICPKNHQAVTEKEVWDQVVLGEVS